MDLVESSLQWADADRAGCVSPEQLVALVDGRVPEIKRLELLDHVMACSRCRREFELLKAISEAQKSFE